MKGFANGRSRRIRCTWHLIFNTKSDAGKHESPKIRVRVYIFNFGPVGSANNHRAVLHTLQKPKSNYIEFKISNKKFFVEHDVLFRSYEGFNSA